MAQGFSLKDQLFNAGKVRYLAGLFSSASERFDAEKFEQDVMSRLPALELKQRIAWIADCLGAVLPGPLPEAATVLRRALPPPLDPSKQDDDFGDFIFAPLGEYVVAAGLEAHPDLVLDLLEEITQRFSMEWALRPVLNRWPEQTLARMESWAGHSSYHVRRLVSEGTRPRLPWGEGVALDLRDPLPLLDRLHADPTRYVTRSVANHLNDIAKKDPDLVLDRLQVWHKEARQTQDELRWLTGHALRGLVKAGHPRALQMLGYDPDASVEACLTLPDSPVRIGDTLAFSVRLEAPEDLPVLVDYRIFFLRPGGSVSQKVFKLKQARITGGKPLDLGKSHKLKANATTFQLCPGPHRIEVMVNGVTRADGVVRFVA